MAATSTSLLRLSLALSTSATGRYLPWERRPI